MINEVLRAIAVGLTEAYPDYPVYLEEIEQGLTPPCFYVSCIEISQKRELMGRAFRTQPFQVVYFPKSTTGRKAEMLGVLDQLLIGLQQIVISDGSVLNGTGLSGRFVDETLLVFVNYDLFLREVKEEASMDGVVFKGGVKNE